MRIGIVEDQILYQRYLRSIVSEQLGYEVVLCCRDGETALKDVGPLGVELLILDLKIDGVYGIDIAERLLAQNSSLKILTYSAEINAYNLRMIESLGINGYLDKCDPVMQSDDFLVEAIRNVVKGKKVYTPGISKMASELSSDDVAFHKLLSPKKILILKYIGKCMTDAEIAQETGLSSHTVRKHRTDMIHQLDLDSTQSLIRYAQENGFAN